MSANADKENMKEVFETTDAFCNYLWSGLPRNQLLANKVWLRRTHYMINEGDVLRGLCAVCFLCFVRCGLCVVRCSLWAVRCVCLCVNPPFSRGVVGSIAIVVVLL